MNTKNAFFGLSQKNMNTNIRRRRVSRRMGQLALLALAMASPSGISAATIWTGPLFSFTVASGANPNLAANEDRLTTHDWITRGPSLGIYNAATEGGFSHYISPADTAWADGTLANYGSLTYHDWNTWAKDMHGSPQATVGVPAVLHLLTDDIYLSITFISWTSGGTGGFSYLRSTSVPEPTSFALGGLGAALLSLSRRRKQSL